MAFELAEFLAHIIGNDYMSEYMVALGVFLSAAIILRIFKFVVLKKLKAISEMTHTDFDDLLVKIVENVPWQLYLFISFYLGMQFIQIPGLLQTILYYILVLAIAYYAIRAVQEMIDYGAEKIAEAREKEGEEIDTSVLELLSKLLKGAVWGIAIILLLSNLGYDISALIAGLGIGGIAIAFALQNVLVDIFASFSIHFDKPFKVGDYIVLGADSGIVQKVGMKSTRIRTLQGQELVVSNKELTETRIHNYKKMEKRRIVFGFGVTYETHTEKLKKIPGMIREIIARVEGVKLDRVHFKEFADFSLNFEVVYYLDSRDYGKYMDAQQEINFAIREKFEEEDIEMAYPTQKVYYHGPGGVPFDEKPSFDEGKDKAL